MVVKICTPLPVAVKDLDQLNRMAAALAKAAGVPDARVWLGQERTDLIAWFDVGEPTKARPDAVSNLVAAADFLATAFGVLPSTVQNLYEGRRAIGWTGANSRREYYYIVRDGRYGGPFVTVVACRREARERHANAV